MRGWECAATSPVPKGEGPQAPSVLNQMDTGTGATCQIGLIVPHISTSRCGPPKHCGEFTSLRSGPPAACLLNVLHFKQFGTMLRKTKLVITRGADKCLGLFASDAGELPLVCASSQQHSVVRPNPNLRYPPALTRTLHLGLATRILKTGRTTKNHSHEHLGMSGAGGAS